MTGSFISDYPINPGSEHTHTFLFIRGVKNDFIGKTKERGADIASETITLSGFQEEGRTLSKGHETQDKSVTIPSWNTETKLKI